VNCAAIPESVLESELFGHEKGAFTGAVTQRKGRFELADGGTLFLDEIGEISASFQAKLLRVLQEGEFERVGGTRTLKVDVRLVCATNQNLEQAVERGTFRSDLYYRINVVPILLPPLRARTGDVPLLAEEFVRRFNAEHGTELSLAGSALGVLEDCYFPGNIRELENCIRRTATLARGGQILDVDFACRNDVCLSSVLWRGAQKAEPAPEREVRAARAAPAVAAPAASVPLEAFPAAACPSPDACPVAAGDSRSERERLVEAMKTAGWVQAKAARLLGLTPRQVGYALRKHGVAVEKF
jgi:Nif-specific regulatory protein